MVGGIYYRVQVAHMPDHLEAGGHVLEGFADRFAQRLQSTAAVGAAGVGRRQEHLFTGQVLR